MIDSFQVTMAPGTQPIATGANVDEILDTIAERVTSIRELPGIAEVKRGFQTRQEFQSQTEQLDEDTRRDAEATKELCVVLDLCSESDDLLQIILDLQGQGVLGFYEPEDKSLTVVSEQEEDLGPLAWLTYAHEYAHALQDQQFGLTKLREGRDEFDSRKALLALVEGDARLTEFMFYDGLPTEQQTLLAESLEGEIAEFSKSPVVMNLPRIIRETWGWEHNAGTDFALRLFLEGGFQSINQAYEDPPQSTEQVLHLEKYLSREPPHDVQLPDLAQVLGDGWQQRHTGVLGELRTSIYLGTFIGPGRAAEAAQGWGGDRYTLLNDDQGRPLIAMRFSWDTPEDAGEFFQAYQELADAKGEGQWELVNTGDAERQWVGSDIGVHLSREDDGTLVIIGPDQATVGAAFAEISHSGSGG